MPDPTHVERWDDLGPWLDQLGLANARPLRRITNDHGAYSPAGRWIVELPDSTRRFVKAMRTRPSMRHGLECEHLVLVALDGSVAPRVRAWHAGSEVDRSPNVLVVDDLSGASWGTPVDEIRARQLRDALDTVATTTPPGELDALPAIDPWPGCGWQQLLERPAPLVARGLVDDAWLAQHGHELRTAAETIDCSGQGLVHGDLWLQNWCSTPDGARLVDWTGAAIGNPRLNHAWGECGVRAAGGPSSLVLGADDPDHDGWAAWMCGLACSFVAFDDFDRAEHRRLHLTQLREAAAALEWVCEALDIELPGTLRETAVAAGPWQP